MAKTDYQLAARFRSEYPHSFNALQGLVMAMAKYRNNRDKQPILGTTARWQLSRDSNENSVTCS